MIKRKDRRDYQTAVETSSTVQLTNEQIAEKFIAIKLKAAIDILDKYSINVRNLILEFARYMNQAKLCEQSKICRMTHNYTGVYICHYCHYCNYYSIYNVAKLSYYFIYTVNSTEQLVVLLLAVYVDVIVTTAVSFLNRKLSATIVIPIDIERKHGLDGPSEVMAEEIEDGILKEK
jgi:hypothetical protein